MIGRGKYQLKQQYQYLQVTESKQFLMTPEQRKNHLTKLESVALKSTIEGDALDPLCPELSNLTESTLPQLSSRSNDDSSVEVSPSGLSVDVSRAATLVNVPIACLEGIIMDKSKKFLETDGAIAPAPGQLPEARMVLSYSRKAPHMVTPKKNGDFSCDPSSPNWKSLGICSHSVAVAETNGQLQPFLLSKKKKTPNVTSLFTTNMPKGRGQKGGVYLHVYENRKNLLQQGSR